MITDKKCPKCGGVMYFGRGSTTLIDAGNNTYVVSNWHIVKCDSCKRNFIRFWDAVTAEGI